LYRKSIPKQKYLFKYAKRRAKNYGLEFNIDIEDVIIPDYCPVLQIKLNLTNERADNDSPSIDRIDNSKGYIKGNIEVISYRANRLKNDASLEELLKLVNWLQKRYS